MKKANKQNNHTKHSWSIWLGTAILLVIMIILIWQVLPSGGRHVSEPASAAVTMTRPNETITPTSTEISPTFTATAAVKESTSSAEGSLPAELSPSMSYEVINAFPHDPQAYTQGLIYLDGFLYESTGLYGGSTLRKVDLETGEVLQRLDLSGDYFAEGLTAWKDTLIQLTWREGAGFIYQRADFSLLDQFTYSTEGWGLTEDGQQLIMSDGTSTLYFIDPTTLQVVNTVNVTDNGNEIVKLNELEYIRGEVFANIYQTDNIARIDPVTGEVKGWIDVSGILPEDLRMPSTDVLNGIAYDLDGNRLFVTGKLWPRLYEIRLVPIAGGE